VSEAVSVEAGSERVGRGREDMAIKLTRGQEQVASMIGGLRAEIVMAPEASDEVRELTRRLDLFRESVNALVSRDRVTMIEERATEYRARTLIAHGWEPNPHAPGWRKRQAIDSVSVGQ